MREKYARRSNRRGKKTIMISKKKDYYNSVSVSEIRSNASSLLLALQTLRAFSSIAGSTAFVPPVTSLWKPPLLPSIQHQHQHQHQHQQYHDATAQKFIKTIPVSSMSLLPLFGIIREEFDLNYDDDDYDDDDDELNDDDYLLDNDNEPPPKDSIDYSGCSSRQFSLGYDLQLTAFAGSLGFEEVTDWEYSNPDTGSVVDPPPFDPKQPKRTREKSGSVIRIFRGDLAGLCGAKARSKGLDTRVLVKEFSGKLALRLAKTEAEALAVIQSKVCREVDDSASNGDWAKSAVNRYWNGRVDGSTLDDDSNLLKWMEILAGTSSSRSSSSIRSKSMPFTALLGELNLSEFLEDEAGNARNEWYRALSVAPPKTGSRWLVYEYTGLTTLGTYAIPALRRWSNLPLRKNLWGSLKPPPSLPPFRERSKYVVQGILKGSLQALETIHASGLAHRSIGRNSIILSSVGQDKTEACSPLATVIPRLNVKLADFGFSGRIVDSSDLEDFCRRAKAFQLDIRKGSYYSLEAKSFAIAEDLHAMGFVFVAVLLSSLAEVPDAEYVTPPTDEDSLQRLLSDIFDKDMGEFREYCEAEDIWTGVVELLNENDAAGWKVLENMCFARERVV